MTSRPGIAVLLAVVATSARAQTTPPCVAGTRDLVAPSARRLLGEMPLRGAPLRDVIGEGALCSQRPSDSVSLARRRYGAASFSVIVPTARLASIGGVADPRDFGAAWTGRGLTAYARAGITFDAGPVHATLAPDVWHAQNSSFEVFPSRVASRSGFASPWYSDSVSADLPSRFGTSPVTQFDLGESALWVSTRFAELGVSSASQAWGPGVRGHILLGPDVQSIPRLFLQTPNSIRTPIGVFDAGGFIGTLTESRFFDSDTSNDYRRLSAIFAAWTPTDSGNFAIGFSHASLHAGGWFGGTKDRSPQQGTSDHINTLFVRYGDPAGQMRAYGEVGRPGGTPSLRQFMSIPYQNLVYLFGLQRAIRLDRATLLVSGEVKNLEENVDIRGVSPRDLYTSDHIVQGWTQRGRVIGDATGPGSNSQWLSLDWITSRWSAGGFAERVRWNEDALKREYLPYPNRHDVTLRGGVRGGYVLKGQELTVEASLGKRFDYLFQNSFFIPGYRTVDVVVPELRISVSPAAFIK